MYIRIAINRFAFILSARYSLPAIKYTLAFTHRGRTFVFVPHSRCCACAFGCSSIPLIISRIHKKNTEKLFFDKTILKVKNKRKKNREIFSIGKGCVIEKQRA